MRRDARWFPRRHRTSRPPCRRAWAIASTALRNLGERAGDCLRHPCVFAMNCPQKIDRGFSVESSRARIPLFGRYRCFPGHGSQLSSHARLRFRCGGCTDNHSLSKGGSLACAGSMYRSPSTYGAMTSFTVVARRSFTPRFSNRGGRRRCPGEQQAWMNNGCGL